MATQRRIATSDGKARLAGLRAGNKDNKDNSSSGEFFDDGIGEIGDSNVGKKESKSNVGSDLAKDFYEQVRKREKSTGLLASTSPEELLAKEARKKNRDPFLNIPKEAKDVAEDESIFTPLPSNRKFTGRREPESLTYRSQNSLFSPESRRRGDESGPMTPREQMMQQEFDLATRAERGIAIQAVFAAAILCFYIYVGLTGGIKTGDDAINDFPDFDDDDSSFELVVPAQKDQEASIWL